METHDLAGFKKKASQQGRTILFIDESGLSTRPTRARTWALRGHTPVLQETFNWKSLSIIGGLALWRFYFQIHAGSIKSPQVIEFLRHLQRHIPGKSPGHLGRGADSLQRPGQKLRGCHKGENRNRAAARLRS